MTQGFIDDPNKVAVRQLTRGANGNVVVQFMDASTGKVLNNLDGYKVSFNGTFDSSQTTNNSQTKNMYTTTESVGNAQKGGGQSSGFVGNKQSTNMSAQATPQPQQQVQPQQQGFSNFGEEPKPAPKLQQSQMGQVKTVTEPVQQTPVGIQMQMPPQVQQEQVVQQQQQEQAPVDIMSSFNMSMDELFGNLFSPNLGNDNTF